MITASLLETCIAAQRTRALEKTASPNRSALELTGAELTTELAPPPPRSQAVHSLLETRRSNQSVERKRR